MPTLLHISVFLFLAGLVDFLIPTHTTVAHDTLGCILAFTLAYAILTVLPNNFLNCSYGTPLSASGYTWRISQFSVSCQLVQSRYPSSIPDYLASHRPTRCRRRPCYEVYITLEHSLRIPWTRRPSGYPLRNLKWTRVIRGIEKASFDTERSGLYKYRLCLSKGQGVQSRKAMTSHFHLTSRTDLTDSHLETIN